MLIWAFYNPSVYHALLRQNSNRVAAGYESADYNIPFRSQRRINLIFLFSTVPNLNRVGF